MAEATVRLDDLSLNELLYGEDGPVADTVRNYAQGELLALARDTIGRSWPGGGNPPSGPPYRRSGQLYDSLAVEDVHSGSGGPETVIIANAFATRKSGTWNYADILIGRGYHFLPDEFYDY